MEAKIDSGSMSIQKELGVNQDVVMEGTDEASTLSSLPNKEQNSLNPGESKSALGVREVVQ